MRFWRNLRIDRIGITRHARIGSLWIRKPKNPSYPHTGDNYVENISSYPPNGDNQVDNLGTSSVRVPIPLVVICLSEPKVICSPLFLKRWVSADAAGTASAAMSLCRAFAHSLRGLTCGSGWRCTWFGQGFRAIYSSRIVWKWSRRPWHPTTNRQHESDRTACQAAADHDQDETPTRHQH